MIDSIPDRKVKGRGATSNLSGRFEKGERLRVDDGWWQDEEELAKKLNTELLPDKSKGLINYNSSPDLPFDRSINPYKGCEHGCIYCFARPTHSYLNLSPGLDFETKIFYKQNIASLLEDELQRPGYKCKPIAIGVNTDAYQPAEMDLRVTRKILEVLSVYRHPFSIITKSSRILRDLDILVPMARIGLASAVVSVTTLKPTLARIMEPRASRPENRLSTVKKLNNEGVPTGVLVSPIIPAINDEELENILEKAVESGASQVDYIMVRLPFELKQLFTNWLQEHFPDKSSKVLNLIREIHSGKLYDSDFRNRMRGKGPYAEMISARFDLTCKRLGLNHEGEGRNLDCSKFCYPSTKYEQLNLF